MSVRRSHCEFRLQHLTPLYSVRLHVDHHLPAFSGSTIVGWGRSIRVSSEQALTRLRFGSYESKIFPRR